MKIERGENKLTDRPWRWEGESVGLVTFQYRGLEEEEAAVSVSNNEGAEQNNPPPSSLKATFKKSENKLKSWWVK